MNLKFFLELMNKTGRFGSFKFSVASTFTDVLAMNLWLDLSYRKDLAVGEISIDELR